MSGIAATIQSGPAPAQPQSSYRPAGVSPAGKASVFALDKYFLSQRIALRTRYDICDERGASLLSVRRKILALKRHIYISDATGDILTVFQDNFFMILYARFTLADNSGNVIARFRRHNIRSAFRAYWEVFNPDGSLHMIAREDSLGLAFLRRLVPFFGFIKTDYDFYVDGAVTAEFQRKRLTFVDRYFLDLTKDTGNRIDRRIAIATAILLDTAEEQLSERN